MKNYYKSLFVALFVFSVSFYSSAQQPMNLDLPSPLNTGHYIPGIFSLRDLATPPATGLYVLDYNMYLKSDKYFNKNGDEVKSITGPLGFQTNLSLDVKGYANVLSLIYAKKTKILGNAVFLFALTPVYTTVNPNLAYQRIGLIDTLQLSGNVNAEVSGFGDIRVMPLFLSWHSDQFDFTAGYDFFAPTGRYEKGASDNVGLGYWSHLIQAFGYYYPLKIKGKPSQAMALMLSGSYEMNSKIKGVDVTPGSRFTVEYGISQYLSEQLELTVMGGNNFQVGEDSGNDVWWDKSVKDKIGFASFQIGYWPWKDRLYTSAKYSLSYGEKQRLNMNILQLNLTYVTGLLGDRKIK
ncbi:MAG: transporter [Bacteroidetes bacterium]|nr:transporter [Bacteroidota bacterium]